MAALSSDAPTTEGPSLTDWIGRRERTADTLHATTVQALAATVGASAEPAGADGTAPELRHWLCFLPLAPKDQIGPDGHPRRGGFLPPVPLERRMWAGGRLAFHEPVRVGDALTRESEILNVAEKAGRAGAMVFVTVRNTVSTPRGLAVEEEQDLVYLPMPQAWSPPPPESAPAEPAWSERVEVDEVMLFRFSALTFNGHRIHYDLPYAREREKYPGLVVHGPLQAMLLLDAARRRAPSRRVAGFSFRAVRPLFRHDEVRLLGEADGEALCTANGEGAVGMRARVTWAAG
jgi:3-methylfumaryl-CoA hydratase